MNVTLFENRVFSNDQVRMRSFGQTLIQYDCVLIRGQHSDTDMNRRKTMWIHKENIIYKLKNASATRSQERGLWHLTPWFQISSLHNCEVITSYCLSFLICGNSLWQPQEKKHFSRAWRQLFCEQFIRLTLLVLIFLLSSRRRVSTASPDYLTMTLHIQNITLLPSLSFLTFGPQLSNLC